MTSDSGFCTTIAAQFVRGGQFVQAAQAKVFEEHDGRAVGHGAAHHFGAPDLLDQAALDQRLHDAVHAHTPDLLDLGARDRLAVGDDGQRLQRRLGEARRAGFVADQRLEPRRVFRLSHELPRAGHAGQPIAALGCLMVQGQLFQRRRQFSLLHLLEAPGGLIAFGVLDGSGEHVAQFLQAQRLLRGEEDCFQNEFQFHAREGTVRRRAAQQAKAPQVRVPGCWWRGQTWLFHSLRIGATDFDLAERLVLQGGNLL